MTHHALFSPWLTVNCFPALAFLKYIRIRRTWLISKHLSEQKKHKATYLPIKCNAVISPKQAFLRVHYFCNLQVWAVDVIVQIWQPLHSETEGEREGERGLWEMTLRLCTSMACLNQKPKPLQRWLYTLREWLISRFLRSSDNFMAEGTLCTGSQSIPQMSSDRHLLSSQRKCALREGEGTVPTTPVSSYPYAEMCYPHPPLKRTFLW